LNDLPAAYKNLIWTQYNYYWNTRYTGTNPVIGGVSYWQNGLPNAFNVVATDNITSNGWNIYNGVINIGIPDLPMSSSLRSIVWAEGSAWTINF
jgi:hypothetical protein